MLRLPTSVDAFPPPLFLTSSRWSTDPDLARLLCRPPAFAPTPVVCNHGLVLAAVFDFVRRLQWRCVTFSRPSPECRFGHQASTRWPPPGLVPHRYLRLSNKILALSRSILSKPHRCFSETNLQPREQLSLVSVKSDPSITIRPADKGGRWVVLDSDMYRNECLLQLSNRNFYQPLISAPPPTSRLSSILTDLYRRHFLTKKELHFLLPPLSPKPRRFYTLPKIHKPFSSVGAPPGRPIVSDVGSETHHTAKLIEFFLGPLAQRLPSHLSDSLEVIAKLSQVTLQPESLFCSVDVRSLYTNIPIDEGLCRIRRAFSRFPCADRPDEQILELLHISLTENSFFFEGRSWLQTSGVAMGKAFGGSFANLYLGEWEHSAFERTPLRPSVWFRYQDDVFFIWDHSVDTLHSFVTHLNSQDPHIQVDLTFSPVSVPFLDLELFRDIDSIGYRVWFKPTDSHFLLPRTSHHPPHTHRGILYAQILRWATHCKHRRDFQNTYCKIFPLWLSQGATRSALRSALSRVLKNTGRAVSWSPGFSKCGSSRCSLCPYAVDKLSINAGDRCFPIVHRLSCDSSTCIYVIYCVSCRLVYVGQSGNPFRQRLSEHLRNIRGSSINTPLTRHFRSVCPLSNLRAFAIERCPAKEKRLLKEARWIRRFNSVHPMGLNLCEGHFSRPLNLVTFPSDCTASLNNAIRRACDASTNLKVQFAHRRTPNLRSIFS